MKTASIFLYCAVLGLSPRLNAGDLKVKQLVTVTFKNAQSNKSSQHEETVYVQGSRQRMDYRVPDTADARQPHTAEITDCRALSGYRVDFNSRKYVELKLRGFPSQEQVLTLAQQQEKWAKKRYSA